MKQLHCELKVTIFSLRYRLQFSYLYFPVAGKLIVCTPPSGTNKEKRYLIKGWKKPTFAENNPPMVHPQLSAVFSPCLAMREKVGILSEVDIKILFPADHYQSYKIVQIWK